MMIMVTRKKGFCNQIGPTRQKYIFYTSLTMEDTNDNPHYKYNLNTSEMKCPGVDFKTE